MGTTAFGPVRRIGLLAVFLWALSGAGRLAVAAEVIVYTEHYPPYSFSDGKGMIGGHCTELVRRVMDESGLDYKIKLVPWNRAYTLGGKLDDVLLFSLLDTPDRHDKFHWIVPLLETTLYLYGRPEIAAGFTPSMLRGAHLRGACVLGDISCAQLRELGLPAENIVESPDTYRSEGKLLEHGRADVFIAQAQYNPLHKGEPGHFVKLMPLPGRKRFFLAAGRQVRPEIVAAVQAAYDRLKAAGQIETVQGAG